MSVRYCGRQFSDQEMEAIRALIEINPEVRRAGLSRLVCEKFDWRSPNGKLKDMSCRVAMLRMQDDGLIQLPPPRNGNNNGKPYRRRTTQVEPNNQDLITTIAAMEDLRLELVSDRCWRRSKTADIRRRFFCLKKRHPPPSLCSLFPKVEN